MAEQKKKVLAGTAGVTDPSLLFVNSQVLEGEMIDFALNVGCETYSLSLRSSLSHYLREFRVSYFTVTCRAYNKRIFGWTAALKQDVVPEAVSRQKVTRNK